MNLLTCTALLCLKVETVSADKRVVFCGCLGLALVGLMLCIVGDRKGRWGQERACLGETGGM